MKDSYYFSKVPKKWREEGLTKGFDSDYYFRFVIRDYDQDIRFEDNCNRCVPISFIDLKKMRKTLDKIIKDRRKEYDF